MGLMAQIPPCFASSLQRTFPSVELDHQLVDLDVLRVVLPPAAPSVEREGDLVAGIDLPPEEVIRHDDTGSLAKPTRSKLRSSDHRLRAEPQRAAGNK